MLCRSRSDLGAMATVSWSSVTPSKVSEKSEIDLQGRVWALEKEVASRQHEAGNATIARASDRKSLAQEKKKRLAHLAMQLNESDIQGLSGQNYISKFTNDVWLRFRDESLEMQFWDEWWLPAITWVKITVVLASIGVGILTAMDLVGENRDIWRSRALARWSPVALAILFLTFAGCIPNVKLRRNCLFAILVIFLQIVILTDDECLIKIMAQFQAMGGIWAQIAAEYDIDAVQERDFCRSMLPLVVAQLGFVANFLRLSFKMALVLFILTATTYIATSIWAKLNIFQSIEGIIMEVFCMFWVGCTLLWATRRNEVLTRYHFLRYVLEVGAEVDKSLTVWRCSLIADESEDENVASCFSISSLKELFLMAHEKNMLQRFVGKGTMKFHDPEMEEVFALDGWRAVQRWVKRTGVVVTTGLLILTGVDYLKAWNYMILKLVIRGPVFLAIATYLGLIFAKCLQSTKQKRKGLWVVMIVFFTCICLDNDEIVWTVLGQRGRGTQCYGMLAFLTCLMAWMTVALQPPLRHVVSLLTWVAIVYFGTGIYFRISAFGDQNAIVFETGSLLLTVLTISCTASRSEMLARNHFLLEYTREKRQSTTMGTPAMWTSVTVAPAHTSAIDP